MTAMRVPIENTGFDKFLDFVEPDLNLIGDVDRKEIKARALEFGFKQKEFDQFIVLALDTMCEQKKAVKVDKYNYRIIKPNISEKPKVRKNKSITIKKH